MLLKEYLGQETAKSLASQLNITDPDFLEVALLNIDALSLTGRASQFAEAANPYLPTDSVAKCDFLNSVLVKLPPADNSLVYYPYSYLVGKHCIDAGPYAEQVLLSLTEVFTSEFAVRPFFEKYPSMRNLPTKWALSKNEHHRRLATEGLRPYLPWAQKLQFVIDDPTPLLSLCNTLARDPSDYVKTSVSNTINDISKDHQQKVVSLVSSWSSAGVSDKVIHRSLRTLIKQGYSPALQVVGVTPGTDAGFSNVSVAAPDPVTIGQSATLKIELDVSEKTLVDIIIDFPRPSGKNYVKVFKGRFLDPGTHSFSKTIQFSQQTTRTVFPGEHKVYLQINGYKYFAGILNVVE